MSVPEENHEKRTALLSLLAQARESATEIELLCQLAEQEHALGETAQANATLRAAAQAAQKHPNVEVEQYKIVKMQVEISDSAGARETARQITDTGWHARALIHIAEMTLDAELLMEALTVAQSSEDISERVGALCEIAQAQAGFGDPNGAFCLLQLAFQETQNPEAVWRRTYERSSNLYCLAVAYAEIGHTPEAIQTARCLESLSDRSRALIAILEFQRPGGDLSLTQTLCEELLCVVHQIARPNTRADTLLKIVVVLQNLNLPLEWSTFGERTKKD